MSHDNVDVCIVYPADPMGVIPGGIDTFIRGIIRWVPDDITVSLVGVTTDNSKRPVGRWTECDLGRRKFQFFPVAVLPNPEKRGRVPLSVRFSLGLLRTRPEIHADILEFHRVEPSLFFLRDSRPKNAFIHQNMDVLKNPDSDILWSKLPGLFYWLEGKLLRRFSSIFSVREDAVEAYKNKYADIGDRFHFIPTWYDPEIYSPADEGAKKSLRQKYSLPQDEQLLITVGRLDSQKDPLLLAESFQKVLRDNQNTRLLYVGDGVLRRSLEEFLANAGIADRVELLGLRSASEVADLLAASDLFVLSSAYEGMPMCVLESLGSGLPVITTDVGEVRRVVKNDVNGYVVDKRSSDELYKAITSGLACADRWRNIPCTEAVMEYTPEKVLSQVYETYRSLLKNR